MTLETNDTPRFSRTIDSGNSITQFFIPSFNFLSGICIKFWNDHRPRSHFIEFRIDIIDEELDCEQLKDEPYFRIAVPAAHVPHANEFYLYFPVIENSEKLLIRLMISAPDAPNGEGVAVNITGGMSRIAGHVRLQENGCDLGNDLGLEGHVINSDPAAAKNYPEGIVYSPLSSCNMNCVHCISKHTRKRSEYMPEDIRRDISERVKSKQLRRVSGDYAGDLFFADHKNPGELDFFLNLRIQGAVYTNGAYLTESRIEKLLTSSVTDLHFSMDAATTETFQKIRLGAPPIDQIFDTVRAVVDARARHGREKNFTIYMNYAMMASNLHELPLFIQKSADAGADWVCAITMQAFHPDMESESVFHHIDYYNLMRLTCIHFAQIAKIKLQMSEAFSGRAEAGARAPCWNPWQNALILPNGDMQACSKPGSKMGNINESSIETIWNSDRYIRLRKRVNSIDPPELCRFCSFRNGLNSYDAHDSFCTGRQTKTLIEELDEEAISYQSAL